MQPPLDGLQATPGNEVTMKALDVTLDQILPGLPSPGHGCIIGLLQVLPQEWSWV